MSRLSDRLELLLVDEPPYLTRDGGFIKSHVHAPLDELRTLAHESRRVIAGLENQYRQRANVPALKIKHNGVLGYFIEVTQQHGDKLMAYRDEVGRDLFRHRQTMAGAVRFSTDELADLASRIAQSAEASLELERALFDEMTALALEHEMALGGIADALAVMDVSVALAELAVAAALCASHARQWLGIQNLTRAAIRWWKRRSRPKMRAASCPMIATFRRTARGVCGWLPAPIWRANPLSCARMR